MNRLQLIQRVRANTRDFQNATFREQDIIDYINEGIDRFMEVIPELSGLTYLLSNTQIPSLIPSPYHYLLATFSTSRCFFQDDRNYQASTLMNEFEVKLEELKNRVEAGEITIINPETGLAVTTDNPIDYVDLSAYFDDYDDDVDLGVEGV